MAFLSHGPGMDPTSVAQALRLLAEGVDSSESPSASAVASSLEGLLEAIETDDHSVRTAFLKGLKRKVVNTKLERKVLEKIDRVKALAKKSQKLIKLLGKGEEFSNLVDDEEYANALAGSMEFLSAGSEVLQELKGADADEIPSLLAELDEHYEEADFEDDEVDDRKALAHAVEQFIKKCGSRVKELEKKFDKMGKKEKPEKKKSDKKPSKGLFKKKAPPKEEEEDGSVDVDLGQMA